MYELDKKTDERLAAQGVAFSVGLRGETERDGWKCDEWRAHFRRVHLDGRPLARGKAGELKTAFYTGLGHRKAGKATAPTAASVLYALLQDASGADENFTDWCANYGQDTDSRKALAAYEACCSIRADVNKFFTAGERAELAAILEDY